MLRRWLSAILVFLVSSTSAQILELDIESDLQNLPKALADDIRNVVEHTQEFLLQETSSVARAEQLGQLASIFHAQQLLAAAEQVYTAALQEQEGFALRYLLAIIVLQRGDLATAASHLSQVVISNPDYVPAWYRLGSIHLMSGRFEDARTAYLNANQIYTNSAAILTGLADVHMAQEQWRDAIEQLDKAWVYEPGNGQIAYKLATAHQQMGNEEEFEKWRELANPASGPPSLEDPLLVEIAGMSQNARFFSQAADWAFQRRDLPAAEQALIQATQLEPGNLEYALKYSTLLSMSDRKEDAINEMKRFLAVSTNSAAGWHYLARLMVETQDGEEYLQGLVAAQRAVALDESVDDYRSLAAAMSLQVSLYGNAQEYYMQLVEKNPTNPYYYYWFGLSRLAENHCDGREALGRAVAMKRDWGEAHVALARADAFCGEIEAASARLDALSKAAADPDIQSAKAFVALLAVDLEQATQLAEGLLPDPDAQAVIDAVDTGARPTRIFAEGSTWWIPPELIN